MRGGRGRGEGEHDSRILAICYVTLRSHVRVFFVWWGVGLAGGVVAGGICVGGQFVVFDDERRALRHVVRCGRLALEGRRGVWFVAQSSPFGDIELSKVGGFLARSWFVAQSSHWPSDLRSSCVCVCVCVCVCEHLI